MTDVKVRIATTDDMAQIMALAVDAAKENGFLDASTTLLAKAVWGPINQDHGIIGCIGTPGQLIEGMVVLTVGTIFYSETPCLEERVIFVRPEYRQAKGGRAKKLIKFSKSAADRLNLPLLIGVLSNERTDAKCKLYERELGPPAGAYWIYQTRTGGHSVTA
jgi:hypothetical protein